MTTETSNFSSAVLDQGDIVVALADSYDDHLNACFPQLPEEPFEKKCWVLANENVQFSVHVAFDGTEPPYAGVGALVATVFFDGIRVSDAFITKESVEMRAQENLPHMKKEDDEIHGATEICGSPGDEGMMGRFYFGVRRMTAKRVRWVHPESLGQIRVEVRWSRLQLGLSGSMKPLYLEAHRLSEGVSKKQLKGKHRLIAALLPETLDPYIVAERTMEGGYRFEHEPLDDKVYVFKFYYAEQGNVSLYSGFTHGFW